MSKENLSNEKELVRLNRYLAMAGVGSRRSCDAIILEGRIEINGEVVERLGTRVDPQRDEVLLDGKPVQAAEDPLYILLHKPERTVTSVKDERKRKTVVDLVGTSQRLFPVGRLDYLTTGALLLTNDGELSYFLIHPRFEVKKIYRVMLNKVIRAIDLHNFQNGLDLDGRKTAPCKIRELRRMGNRSYLEVEIHEGRNRQIRRMFDILNYHVEELQRINFAGLTLQDLKSGEWRELSPRELKDLKSLVERQRSAVLGTEHEEDQ